MQAGASPPISIDTLVFERGRYRKGARLVRIAELAGVPRNSQILEGAIRLRARGRVILDDSRWDQIDLTWTDLLQAVRNCAQTGRAEFTLPDRNRVHVHLEMQGPSRVLIDVRVDGELLENRAGTLGLRSLIDGVCVGAEQFLEWLERQRLGSPHDRAVLEELKKIGARLS